MRLLKILCIVNEFNVKKIDSQLIILFKLFIRRVITEKLLINGFIDKQKEWSVISLHLWCHVLPLHDKIVCCLIQHDAMRCLLDYASSDAGLLRLAMWTNRQLPLSLGVLFCNARKFCHYISALSATKLLINRARCHQELDLDVNMLSGMTN